MKRNKKECLTATKIFKKDKCKFEYELIWVKVNLSISIIINFVELKTLFIVLIIFIFF
jgi:hypothetical protein